MITNAGNTRPFFMQHLATLAFGMLFLFCGHLTQAQTQVQGPGRPGGKPLISPREADSLRVDVLNKEIHLNSEESKNFWPAYEEYLSKLEAIQTKAARENAVDRKAVDQLNEARLNLFINRDFEVQQQKLALKKEYDQIFRRILPLRKLAHFYIAQNQFSRQLIRYRISKGLNHPQSR